MDLLDFVTRCIPETEERSVIVITSKIVALWQRRTVSMPSVSGREALIRSSSTCALRTRHAWITISDGMLSANAGIDDSNGDGRLILPPENPYGVASALRDSLRSRYHTEELGVLITDSRTYPLRAGVTAVALGYAGFSGIRDYRGRADLFGRPFRYERTNVADSLATAAALEMGEGDESRPLARITGASIDFIGSVDVSETYIDPADDLYGPLLTDLCRERERGCDSGT